MKFKLLNHTADIKFQAFGKDIPECFNNSLLAFRNVITKDNVKPKFKKEINIEGKDYSSLLYNFLEEFIFILDRDNMIVSVAKKISINKTKEGLKLTAQVYFDYIKNYKTITDVKAITYNDMFIKEEKGKYVCQVVVDV